MIYCDNTECEHYQENQPCQAPDVYLVDRVCVTAKRKHRDENYIALMRGERPRCHKTQSGYKSNGTGMVLK